MNFFNPFFYSSDCLRNEQMPKPYKSVQEALLAIEKTYEKMKEDAVSYNYLISAAPTKEEKDIFKTIQDSNMKHSDFLREIYAFYKKQKLSLKEFSDFIYPKSYMEGIKAAKLANIEKISILSDIRAGIPDVYYKDMISEMMTDVLTITFKFDHILYLCLEKGLVPLENTRQVKEFTPAELAKFNGESGKPAYVAINGIVYDVSFNPVWGGGSHFGLIAGKDLTLDFESCHMIPEVLDKLPRVGILKSK